MSASPRIHQMTVSELEERFKTQDAVRNGYSPPRRLPVGLTCPRCGVQLSYVVGLLRWQCHKCAYKGYRFSVIAGTVFENTKLPLRTWFKVFHWMVVSKKGISALQAHRMIGTGSYESAWYMCMRIRAAMRDKEFHQLMGIVEVDETFVGGKAKNRHKTSAAVAGAKARTPHRKVAVVCALSRSKKTIVARVIGNASLAAIGGFVREKSRPRLACSLPINGGLRALDAIPARKR